MEPLTLEGLRALPRNCPLIYDNDWLRDTPDDEYVLAKARLGEADLRGLMVTKDLWDCGQHFRLEQCMADFQENVALVRRSGWATPEPVAGADRFLDVPASGRVEDFAPLASAGHRPRCEGGAAGERGPAARGVRRRAAEYGRERVPDRSDDRGADGRDDDRPHRLQRTGPLGQPHAADAPIRLSPCGCGRTRAAPCAPAPTPAPRA